MKLTIRGVISHEVIAQALNSTLHQIGFDADQQVIKGMTMYFTVYDRETGEAIDYVDGTGKIIESTEWSAPRVTTGVRKTHKFVRGATPRKTQIVPSYLNALSTEDDFK